MQTRLVMAAFLLVLVSACSTVTQEQAEDAAKDFVRSRVVFFTRQADDTQAVGQTEIKVAEAALVGKEWHITLEAATETNETQKQGKMQLIVNSKGRVTSFNGQPAK